MTVRVDEVEGIRRVALAGRLDADGVAALDEEFAAATTAEADVIVDLSDVEFLASLGIRMLVAASQEQSRMGGTLVLVGPDEQTMRILRTTGIDQVIPVRETAADAADVF